jgi:hypothetical protein
VGLPIKCNVHLCQKVPFVLACFEPSAAPRPKNSDSNRKDPLFGLDTQITIIFKLALNVEYGIILNKKLYHKPNLKNRSISRLCTFELCVDLE